MKKFISSLLIFTSFAFAKYEIIENDYIYTIKIDDTSFEQLYVDLKSEIEFNSFVVVHELDLAKSTKEIAKYLDKQAVLNKGKNILICKSSFTLQMHEENIENITYCPLNISVYSDKNHRYISFRKYHKLRNNDKIADDINMKLKKILLDSLN